MKLRLEMLGEPRLIPYFQATADLSFDTGRRLANVLSICADKIGWSAKTRRWARFSASPVISPSGGYAAHSCFRSFGRARLRSFIHRAVCVADVGESVNPLWHRGAR